MSELPAGLVATGVFATKEEIEDCFRVRPVMFLSGGQPMFKSAQETVHQYALAHGLPEIIGYYGMTREGEFVRQA